jgi:hypothetical protein
VQELRLVRLAPHAIPVGGSDTSGLGAPVRAGAVFASNNIHAAHDPSLPRNLVASSRQTVIWSAADERAYGLMEIKTVD